MAPAAAKFAICLLLLSSLPAHLYAEVKYDASCRYFQREKIFNLFLSGNMLESKGSVLVEKKALLSRALYFHPPICKPLCRSRTPRKRTLGPSSAPPPPMRTVTLSPPPDFEGEEEEEDGAGSNSVSEGGRSSLFSYIGSQTLHICFVVNVFQIIRWVENGGMKTKRHFSCSRKRVVFAVQYITSVL